MLSARPALAGKAKSAAFAVAREYIDAFIVAGLVALFLITFVIRTFYIPSGSMEPTLQVKDVLLVNEFEYRFHGPNRGDIVVFKPPIPSPDDFIKRVIAVPGDTLAVHDGTVYVNGMVQNEPFVAAKPDYDLEIKDYSIYVQGDPLDPTTADVPPRGMWQAPDRVPNGFYVVMGDNRNASADSHVWGFAQLRGHFVAGPLADKNETAEFTGRAFLRLWPLRRLHILN